MASRRMGKSLVPAEGVNLDDRSGGERSIHEVRGTGRRKLASGQVSPRLVKARASQGQFHDWCRLRGIKLLGR